MKDTQRKQLIRGLIGPDREHLFLTSAQFRMNIEYLADTLPLWVEGLARAAQHSDETVRLHTELLMRTPVDMSSLQSQMVMAEVDRLREQYKKEHEDDRYDPMG